MINHKQGDSWSYAGQAEIFSLEGNLLDLTGWTIKSQLRNATGALVCEFDTAWVDPIIQTFTHQRLSTEDWPLGQLRMDIQVTSPSGFRISTPTLVVLCNRQETLP